MSDLPSNQLNPRIKIVWRLGDGLGVTLLFLMIFVPFFIVSRISDESWISLLMIVLAILYGVLLFTFLVIVPPIRFARWRYALSEDYLDIARGIVWRKRFIVPFIRVQNTDTRQGPILRAFGLSSVTVSTAAGEHVIPGLASNEADELRDKAAELARLAREDL